MKRYNIYASTHHTTSWGEPCVVAGLDVKERPDGEWVKAADATKNLKDFSDELKQLCKDFSDLRDRPYMGDVHSMFDSLLERFLEPEEQPPC